MSRIVHSAAVFCVAAGLLAGIVVAVSARSGRTGLRVGLDLWLAAGVLNLSSAAGWEAPLTAVLVLIVRQTANLGLRRPADLAPRWPHRRPRRDQDVG